MNLTKTSIFALVLALCLSCKHEADPSPTFCDQYTPGGVSLMTTNGFLLPDVFALFNADDLSIQHVFFVNYTSNISGDSAAAVIDYLNSKPYIKVEGWAANNDNVFPDLTTKLTFFVPMSNLTLENQADWLATVSALKLTEQPSEKIILLGVPVGLEKTLVLKYRKNTSIKSVDLICPLYPL